MCDFEHIKGHQDKKKRYEDLDLQVKMNVDVDILAVAFHSQNRRSTMHIIQLPVNLVQLYTRKMTVNSHYFWKLRDHATKQPLLDHIK